MSGKGKRHISLFALSISYVLVSHCQQARYVHQLEILGLPVAIVKNQK